MFGIHWLHQLISCLSAGVSSSRPSSQCTDSLVPPEQTHWNVNSLSPIEPDTWPAPLQYGQVGSLDIELPSTNYSYLFQCPVSFPCLAILGIGTRQRPVVLQGGGGELQN